MTCLFFQANIIVLILHVFRSQISHTVFFCTLYYNVSYSILVDTDVAKSSTELSGVQNVTLYSYKELSMATNGFSPANKIGEGGFGSVFKVKNRFSLTFFIVFFGADYTDF